MDLGGTLPPPFTDICPIFSLSKKVLKIVFLPKTHLFLGQKRLQIWGVPPSPPLQTKIFGEKRSYRFVRYSPTPPTPITDKIHKLVFDVLPNMGILLIEQVLALNLCSELN